MRQNNDINDVFVAGQVTHWELQGAAGDKVALRVTVREQVNGGQPRVYDVPVVLVSKVAKVYLDRLRDIPVGDDTPALYIAAQGYLSPNYVSTTRTGESSPVDVETHVVLVTHVVYLGDTLDTQLTRVALSGEVSYWTATRTTTQKDKQWFIVQVTRKQRNQSSRSGVPVILFEHNDRLDQPVSKGSFVAVSGRLEGYVNQGDDTLRLQVIALNNMVDNHALQVVSLPDRVRDGYVPTASSPIPTTRSAPPTQPASPSAPAAPSRRSDPGF